MSSERFLRHITLSDFGQKSQEKLGTSKVLVVGAGGLGCPIIQYLSACGIGTLGIIDGDLVSESNLHRQILFTAKNIGENKAKIAGEKVKLFYPECITQIYETELCVSNCRDIIPNYDLIIDGSDLFSTRYLVNDACVEYNKPFISGAISKWTGQIMTCNFNNSPSYRCLFPEPPSADNAPRCSEDGVLGVLPGIIGTITAMEAVKILTGVGETLAGKLLIYNTKDNNINPIKVPKTEIGINESFIRNEKYYSDLKNLTCKINSMNIKTISPKDLSEKLKSQPELITLIDVREQFEKDIADIGGALIPLGELDIHVSEIPKKGDVVIYCKAGGRSAKACEMLTQKYGYNNLINLTGGINGWSDEVDPSVTRY